MKKGTVIIITLLLVFTGCAVDQGQKNNEELLRYTNESGKISSIYSKEKSDKIKRAFGHTKWNQKKFNNQSGYYSVLKRTEKNKEK
ncbi:hypothetical protein SAMN02982927_03546 [Sporolactobacillus nakayamae]|uniref:Lipoprotein n=1 Tax=Sporolactobacillus nakayamae TaxID=269670 RepID=A0A1I2WIZ8_9BACL|nr:hypothetical protein SAMN02982927_03546 [Sporolactobacillus nakayamae]